MGNEFTEAVLQEVKKEINRHIDETIEAHHLAYVYVDPDNVGPKGGKLFIYVCSCGEGYERKKFAYHQARMLKLE